MFVEQLSFQKNNECEVKLFGNLANNNSMQILVTVVLQHFCLCSENGKICPINWFLFLNQVLRWLSEFQARG